jgi:hypothetical protein
MVIGLMVNVSKKIVPMLNVKMAVLRTISVYVSVQKDFLEDIAKLLDVLIDVIMEVMTKLPVAAIVIVA